VPTQARALSWIDPATGERRFARRVAQGPIQARQQMEWTLGEVMREVEALLTATLPDVR
jgi:hypothetical protein